MKKRGKENKPTGVGEVEREEKSVGGGETERFGDKQRMTKTERASANKRKLVCMCETGREEGAVMCTAACGWASVQSNQIQVAPAAVSQNPITATTPFLRPTQPLRSLSSSLAVPPPPNQTQWTSHSILWYTLFCLWSHPVRFKRIAHRIKFYTVFPWHPAARGL